MADTDHLTRQPIDLLYWRIVGRGIFSSFITACHYDT